MCHQGLGEFRIETLNSESEFESESEVVEPVNEVGTKLEGL